MSKLVGISRSKYRVAVSDILPYERPIFFTNRFFVRFMKNYGIQCRNGRLVATKNLCPGLASMLALLGGVEGAKRPAFQYRIAKSSTEQGRRLSVIHPYHQVSMVEFYDRYKTLILDYCQRSRYSIRYPYKMAVVQKKPKGFPKYLSDEPQDSYPEESIKHFFAYKHYHNINEFYDDYRYLRAERRFALMEKTDLEHCFDSVRPEQLSEAMFGCVMGCAEGTMPYHFWQLNQSYENRPENGGSGTGLVIGPEFSRLYAEIILQRVDVDCETKLEREGIELNRDYVFYRYVDDGFLFCNTEDVRTRFNVVYGVCLAKYGLKQGGEDKHMYFNRRPFLESITAGKLALKQLIEERFENRLKTFRGFVKVQSGDYDTPTALDYKAFIQAFRAIMQTYGLKYKEVLSYALGVIDKRLGKLLHDYNDLYKQYCQAEYMDDISEQGLLIKQQYECDFLSFLDNLVDVLFYFFSCDSRMNTSIKVVGIINRLQLFVRGMYRFDNGDESAKFAQQQIDAFDAMVTDQTQKLFASVCSANVNHIETLNFLELQKIMSTSVQLHPRKVEALYEAVSDHLNFFVVFQLFHFVKNDNRYDGLKRNLTEWIKRTIAPLFEQEAVSDTEAVLTLLETLCCPWVTKQEKEQIMRHFKRFDEEEKQSLLVFATKQHDLFVKWRDYNIFEEMQHISNTEVY